MSWHNFLMFIICWIKVANSRLWVEGDIRLVGGPRRYMGTVIILHSGRWGAVCDDNWDIRDASVVCRHIGYTSAVRATTQSEFGPGRKKMWLSEVQCSGSEARLDKCSLQFYDDVTHDKCSGRYRSAGAICSAAIPQRASKIKSTGNKLTVTQALTANTNEPIGSVVPVTELENTKYRWNKIKTPGEIKITTASRSAFGDTTPAEKAMQSTTTVKPTDFKQKLSSTVTEISSVRIVKDAEISSVATVKDAEISSVVTVKDAEMSSVATVKDAEISSVVTVNDAEISSVATVKDAELLTTYDFQVISTTVKSSNMTGKGNYINNYQNVFLKDNNTYQVVANESQFGDNSSYILHQETKVALPSLCNMAIRDSKGCEDYFQDDPNVQNFEIRLKGGRYQWEGHLQIRINEGTWGTICSDHWTLREAMVACNQLRDYGKAKQAILTSYFGGMDVLKSVYRIQCVGRELTFGSCNVTWSNKEHSCSKSTAVAGVVCSQHLPDLVPSLRAVEDSIRLQDQPLYYLRCAMEENCLASSAYIIKNTSLAWRNNMRRLLRFSTVVHNRGLADFRPYRPRGQWEWHACHMHYHSMEIFAHYDILDANGTRLAEGSKASFCLEDTTCENGVHPQFNCRGFADQGLSVNCSDNYMYDIDCQWIDISDLKPGVYTFLMEVNPTMLVAEGNFDNNIVSCILYYSGYFASVRNCHYESLLDYAYRKNE